MTAPHSTLSVADRARRRRVSPLSRRGAPSAVTSKMTQAVIQQTALLDHLVGGATLSRPQSRRTAKKSSRVHFSTCTCSLRPALPSNAQDKRNFCAKNCPKKNWQKRQSAEIVASTNWQPSAVCRQKSRLIVDVGSDRGCRRHQHSARSYAACSARFEPSTYSV